MKHLVSALAAIMVGFVLYGQEPKLMLPVGHTERVSFSTFSPDNKKVLTISNNIKIWDVVSGRLLSTIDKYNNTANFSKDGKKIIQGAEIWDIFTGKQVVNMNGEILASNYPDMLQEGKIPDSAAFGKLAKFWKDGYGSLLWSNKFGQIKISATGFSPNETKLVAGSRVVNVWDVRTKQKLFDLPQEIETQVRSVSFSPDGNKILTVSSHDSRLWDASNGRMLLKLPFDPFISRFSPDGKYLMHSGEIWDIDKKKKIIPFIIKVQKDNYSYSPDNALILTISDDSLSLYSAKKGNLHFTLYDRMDMYSMPGFSTDGKKIIARSKVWDTKTGKILFAMYDQTKVSNGTLSHDGKIVAIGLNSGIIMLHNIGSGNLMAELNSKTTFINTAFYSPEGKSIITTSLTGFAKIWDENSGLFLKNLGANPKGQNVVSVSPDGSKIITAYSDNDNAQILNSKTNELLFELKGHEAFIRSAAFSPDGKNIVTAALDKTVKLWDAESGSFIKNIGNYKAGMVNYVRYFPNKNIIITVSIEGSVKLWNPSTGEEIKDFGFNSEMNFLDFSPDEEKVAILSRLGGAKIFDVKSGKKLFELVDKFNTVSFSPDGSTIITGNANSSISLYNAQTGTLVKSIQSPGSRSAFFRNDGKKFITAASGEMVEVFNSGNNEVVYRFLGIENTDYFLLTPMGYYYATNKVAKLLHYVTKDLKVISFEQLDVKYNRPDKVLEAIGNADTALINSYRQAYYKRIKKLGIDTTQFKDGYSVPEADFVNRDSINYEQNKKQLQLKIHGEDSTYTLDRFNIWINEAPLFGQKGISIKSRNKNSFDTTITIMLSQGANRIETSITNVNGTESYRSPLFVKYTPSKADSVAEKLHFIGIGINKFSDKQYNLSWSVKDVRDLSTSLKQKYGNNITIDTLFDEAVSVDKIKALKTNLLSTNVNDKVILAYSGHGLLSKDYDYYLSTYNINFNQPEQNGLPYDELESLLDSIPARKKLMLIDACHSGEVDKEEMLQYQTVQAKLDSTKKKGIIAYAYKDKKKLGTKNSFELMQSLFVNVGKSTGATIISAASGTQFALEKNNLQNGVFTYSILEYLQNHPTATISDLKNYVNGRVVELTNGAQQPTTRNENKQVDWRVW